MFYIIVANDLLYSRDTSTKPQKNCSCITELKIYFEAYYKQTNIRKERSYRYIYAQDAESTVVKIVSYEGNRLFPVWYRALNSYNLQRPG